MDYDRWAKSLNESSWSYENLLSYFKKSENFTGSNPFAPIDSTYHGYSGTLHNTHVVPPQNISANFLKAVEELGYNITDYNGKQQMGASILQYNMDKGQRFDNGLGFLSTVKNRKNLEILDCSYVIKIDISGNEVKGVIFTRNNNTYIARNRKEVILSAGALSSPQILMLSGLGPKDHLESLGIPVIKDLPVGKFLLAHVSTTIPFSSNITFESESLRKSIEDLLQGEGSLTRPMIYDAVGFFKTSVEQNEYPDIEILFGNISKSELTRKIYSYSEETINVLTQNSSNLFTLQPTVLHPKSMGTLTLKSASPFDYPLIDPNVFSDKHNSDLETLYQGVLLILKLLETKAFKSMNVRLALKQFPGCEHTEAMSREYWYCYFRRVTRLVYHEVNTCPMDTNASTGVVDRELKVFGIKHLRVADASVIPVPTTGHTNAPCTMIGEKAADLIKQHYIV